MSGPSAPPPVEPAPAPTGSGWQRLDPRMLVLLPLQELKRWIGVVIGLLVAGSVTGGTWQLYALLIPVVAGAVDYATTRYRVADERVELRHGLINRRHLSARLERVRTVDLTAPLLHRMLGLSTVRIGTGSGGATDDAPLDLDGLPTDRARSLRDELLRRAGESTAAPGEPPPERVAARFHPGWLRYAPFTAGGLAIVGVLWGGLWQVGEAVGIDLRVLPGLERLPDPAETPWLLATLVLATLVLGVLAVVVLSVLAYAAAYGQLVLRYVEPRGPWRLRRGLLTTRETSIDVDRLAGVTVGEPLLLRAVGGARLSAIVTGMRRDDAGASLLVPPAPAAEVAHAAGEMVGTADPVVAPLRPHGPRAVRRRWTRALGVAAVLALAGVAAAAVLDAWWLLLPALLLLPAAAGLALDRSRALGHALTGRFLVARSGSLLRARDVLAREHVIGWNSRATWFQRRAGLTTLQATTAGGHGYVEVLDVPEAEAAALATAAVPGLMEQFLQHG